MKYQTSMVQNQKDLVGSHFADWSSNVFIQGAWASAEPGAFKFREILREPVAEKIYFAGEALLKIGVQ